MNILSFKHIGVALMAAALFSACNDVVDVNYPDRYTNHGAPSITGIYDVQDTGHVSALSSGTLNQMLRIEGANLANVKKITFNGLEVDVRQVYAESGESFVKIPRKIPEHVTDTLVYETNEGKTALYFPVSIPHVELEGLSNEFALQGSEVQLNGDFFDLYNFNDTTDNSPVSITITNSEQGYSQKIHTDSCSETFTSIRIPKDCPDNSLITFRWKEMGKDMSKTVPYRMTSALLFGDLTGDLGWWNDWGKNLVTDGSKSGDPQSLGMSFLRIKGTFDSWSWNSTGIGCNWPSQDFTDHPENYVLKFEVCTNSSTPFADYGANGASGSQNGGYYFDFNTAGVSRHQWDPVSTGLRNTYSKWITVSIPLDKLCEVKQDDGTIKHVLPAQGSWAALEFVMQPNNNEGWTVDHSFGQFRIEPKNY